VCQVPLEARGAAPNQTAVTVLAELLRAALDRE
jgi:hypothetical protein